MNPLSMLLSTLLLAAPVAALPQDAPSAAPDAKVSAEARALLDRMNEAMYAPTRAGLESLQGVLSMHMDVKGMPGMEEMADAQGMGGMPPMNFDFDVSFAAPDTCEVSAKNAQGMMAMMAGPMSKSAKSTLLKTLQGGFHPSAFTEGEESFEAEVVEEDGSRVLVLRRPVEEGGEGGTMRVFVDDRDLPSRMVVSGLSIPGMGMPGGPMGGRGGMGGPMGGGRGGMGGGPMGGRAHGESMDEVEIHFAFSKVGDGHRLDAVTMDAGGMQIRTEYTYQRAGGVEVPAAWTLRMRDDLPALQTYRFTSLTVNGEVVALGGGAE